ncbi:MAG: exosome complex protein Rrp42 [Nanoarchaeota archaeon]
MNEYIINLVQKGLRDDGRDFKEYRPIKIEYGISSKSAEGSVMVKIGDTEVIAGVKMEVGEPFPDSPDEGVLIVNAELIPMASPEFESGPPNIDAIELSRVVDRCIRESGFVDFGKLCIKKGEKVWIVFVDIYPINDSGNLFDAACLAAVAALKNAKFPALDGDKVDYTKHAKELPLKKAPTSCTVINIKDKLLVDPTTEEERVAMARLTVASIGDTICALQKGGEKPLSLEEIDKIISLAVEKNKELVKLL